MQPFIQIIYKKPFKIFFYMPISLLLHSFVDFIDLFCKSIKLRNDEFFPEGLDQKEEVSFNTSEMK